MLARLPCQSLETEQDRCGSLTTHLDHRIWKPTPYIYFKESANAIEELATRRSGQSNRGVQYLTVIDPSTRVRNGLPVLDVAAEMEYYSIPDPYRMNKKYYVGSYVCLWEVAKEEVVGHWEWDELATNENWYEEIIVPAFNKYREERDSASARASTFDMSEVMQSLPGPSPVHTRRVSRRWCSSNRPRGGDIDDPAHRKHQATP
jgi:hypothetical protein